MTHYLLPHEFAVGALGDCVPGSLLLPRTGSESPFLIGATAKGTAALCLGGQFRFQGFESEGNTAWSGIIVPGVQVEVDAGSSPELRGRRASIGCARRQGNKLGIIGRGNDGGRSLFIVLADQLANLGDEAANFERWQVVLGAGIDRRVLFTIDVSAAEHS